MISEIQSLLDSYSLWLRHNTKIRQIDDWVEITTPYLDRHNDCLQVYAKLEDNRLVMTDDGYVINDLELSGCSVSSGKRKELLQMILYGFGIHLGRKTLAVTGGLDDFAIKKHNLVQAMLAVNDLFFLASPTVERVFSDDVIQWMETAKIRFTGNVKIAGKSGFDHRFDFVIPKSETYPERILKVINRPNRNATQSLVFAWIDTRKVRPTNTCAYALLNDRDQDIPSGVVTAMTSYGIEPVPWSRGEESLPALAA